MLKIKDIPALKVDLKSWTSSPKLKLVCRNLGNQTTCFVLTSSELLILTINENFELTRSKLINFDYLGMSKSTVVDLQLSPDVSSDTSGILALVFSENGSHVILEYSLVSNSVTHSQRVLGSVTGIKLWSES